MYLKMKNFHVKFLVIFFLTTFTLSFAQKSKEKQLIDAQIKTADQLYLEIRTRELLAVSTDILLRSEKLNYEKGLVYGNFYFACIFYDINKYNESIKYIRKSQEYKDYLKTDPSQDSKNYGLLGLNYYDVDLFSLSKKNLKKAIEIIHKVKKKDDLLRRNESAFYGSLSILYNKMGKQDSVYYYLNRERIMLEKLNLKDNYIFESYSYNTIGDYFLEHKNSDSALYYYKKSALKLKDKHHPYIVDALVGFGKLYYMQNKNQEAIAYYMKAIETTKKFHSWRLRSAYKGLGKVYEKTGNYKKASDYKTLYIKTDDSLEASKNLERDFVVSEVLRFEKKAEGQHNEEITIKIAGVIATLIILVMIALFYFIRQKRKELINEKETIIHKGKEKTQELQLRVNESFDEVIQLAKANDKGFFTRFREVYPEVVNKILEVDPKLRVSELTLCAYVYLGFTTKDIASYTFKATNTVHSRKYNLRKKLNISPEESMELWLKNLGSQ